MRSYQCPLTRPVSLGVRQLVTRLMGQSPVSYAAAVRPVPMDRFEDLVAAALDELPEPLAARMDNVAVCIDEVHGSEDLLGLYEGIPLTERDEYGMMELPDTITVYRDPICAVCGDEDEVVEQVRITVVHEVAHHFGIDDDALDELGWA